MHWSYERIQLASQEGIRAAPIVERPPDAGECEDCRRRNAEPSFILGAGLALPFAQLRHRDQAPAYWAVQRRSSERARQLPHVRDRRAGLGRRRELPDHWIKDECVTSPRRTTRPSHFGNSSGWGAGEIGRHHYAEMFRDGPLFLGHALAIAHGCTLAGCNG